MFLTLILEAIFFYTFGIIYYFNKFILFNHWREFTFDILRFWDYEKKISEILRITSQKNDKFYISFLNSIGVIGNPESQNINSDFTSVI